MRTSKSISTITYNTPDFLVDALNRLKYLGYIDYFEFILHLGDLDDKKQHIHLYVEPRKVLDTEEITLNYFLEDEATHLQIPSTKYEEWLTKPLKPIAWRPSKYGDWYWYVLHDKGYLKAKMLTRKCFYCDDDIVCSDFDTHRYKVLENPLSNYAYLGDDAIRTYVVDCLANDISLGECLKDARIPIGKTQSVIHFYNALYPTFSASSKMIKEINDGIDKAIADEREIEHIVGSIGLTPTVLPFDTDEIYD